MRLQASVGLLFLLAAGGCTGPAGSEALAAPRRVKPEGKTPMSFVRVRVIGPDGKLTDVDRDAGGCSLRRRVAQAADAGAIPHHPGKRHGAGLLRRLVEQQEGGNVRVRLLQPAAVRVGDEVRIRHRLAQLLPARGDGEHPRGNGPQPRHGPHARSSVAVAARILGTCSTTDLPRPAGAIA